MTPPSIDVAIERGSKRAFASALAWPGWARSGRDEESALDSLLSYGPRYAVALRGARRGFRPPKDAKALVVVERLKGDATTDFGAPSIAPAVDADPVDARELRRLRTILEATWGAFDRAADAARGKKLRTGPRGGGRSLNKIAAHVLSADGGYVRRIAGRAPAVDERDPWSAADDIRDVIGDALGRAAREGLPERGPRGGAMWTVRYFIRRSAWHVLDHTWEIEDRTPGR